MKNNTIKLTKMYLVSTAAEDKNMFHDYGQQYHRQSLRKDFNKKLTKSRVPRYSWKENKLMKYGEDKIVKEIENYIKSTYSEHYSTTKDGFQVQDMLRHLGIDKDFCQANAIKYLARYGKKNGKNRKDLLKAIHYIVLLMSSEDNK